MMQTKMGTSKKAVLVTMYVEKPRRTSLTNGHHHHHHHHHHHVHHTVNREVSHHMHDGAGKRHINRRAELLQYSQHLRKSARTPAFSTLVSKQNSFNQQKTKSQALPIQRKAKASKTLTCLSNCNAMIPSFFKLFTNPQAKKERTKKKKKKKHSGSASNKIQAIIRSLEMKNQKAKLLSTFRKHR